MNKLELNNPIALNNQVRIDEEQARLKAEQELLEKQKEAARRKRLGEDD